MAASQPPLTLIVAATAKNGIGKNGGLPWPMLKKEMAYFARVTKRVPPQTDPSASRSNTSTSSHSTDAKQAQNVVIMGRKTWDSIPPRFRPLKDRTNLIITRQSASTFARHDDVVVADSIEAGLADLRAREQKGTVKPLGRVFVIGGSSIYDAALRMPNARHVLLTRIAEEYECDTYFSVDVERGEGWRKKGRDELEEFVGERVDEGDVVEEVDGRRIGYQFRLYERAT